MFCFLDKSNLVFWFLILFLFLGHEKATQLLLKHCRCHMQPCEMLALFRIFGRHFRVYQRYHHQDRSAHVIHICCANSWCVLSISATLLIFDQKWWWHRPWIPTSQSGFLPLSLRERKGWLQDLFLFRCRAQYLRNQNLWINFVGIFDGTWVCRPGDLVVRDIVCILCFFL